MLKQIYRFLSVLIISNLLFSSAGIGKTLGDNASSDNSKTVLLNNNKDKPINNQKPADKSAPNLEKMPTTTSGENRFTTLYGVFAPGDIYNTYPNKPKSH